jgi:hypothetical protein
MSLLILIIALVLAAFVGILNPAVVILIVLAVAFGAIAVWVNS